MDERLERTVNNVENIGMVSQFMVAEREQRMEARNVLVRKMHWFCVLLSSRKLIHRRHEYGE